MKMVIIENRKPFQDEVIEARKEDDEQLDHPWYKNTMVLWEMSKQLQFKYMSLMKKHTDPEGKEKFILVRYLLGYNPQLIMSSLAHYGGIKPESKLYFDLTYWRETPSFSYNAEKREEQRNEFNEVKWKELMNGFDFPIDIDAPKDPEDPGSAPRKAWKQAREIKEVFDVEKIPYTIKFSGSKGFHFLIPYKYFNPRIKPTNLPDLSAETTAWIIDRFNLKHFDDSIYDHRRVLKLAYSLVGDYVCLPLSDFQFNNFKLEDLKYQNVLDKVRLYNRGDLMRTHGLGETELRKNFDKLIKGKV